MGRLKASRVPASRRSRPVRTRRSIASTQDAGSRRAPSIVGLASRIASPSAKGTRKGGSGLGLVISAELIRGHGGRLDLMRSDAEGTEFAIRLPKSVVALGEAAE